MNICVKCNGNPSNSYRNTSVWTTVVDGLTEWLTNPWAPVIVWQKIKLMDRRRAVCRHTGILRMDLNSRKVRCSASSMGSRWSNNSEALPFLACFFRWVNLRIQSYDGLQGEQFINNKHNQSRIGRYALENVYESLQFLAKRLKAVESPVWFFKVLSYIYVGFQSS